MKRARVCVREGAGRFEGLLLLVMIELLAVDI